MRGPPFTGPVPSTRPILHDSYACRRGKGVHAGVNRLRQFIRQATRNGTRSAWYLQLDIHNYFMSIDKDVLFSLLAPKIDDDDALWLTRVLVYHDCTQDYVIKGDPAMLDKIPTHKTLFKTAPNKGLPIGNLNSQFFANVYLNGLDQFVKHTVWVWCCGGKIHSWHNTLSSMSFSCA